MTCHLYNAANIINSQSSLLSFEGKKKIADKARNKMYILFCQWIHIHACQKVLEFHLMIQKLQMNEPAH